MKNEDELGVRLLVEEADDPWVYGINHMLLKIAVEAVSTN